MPKAFLKRYTHDLTSDELGKLFTRETPEAYHFFAKGINTAELEGLPWYRKAVKYAQGFFLAFTMRLSPARRLMYGVSLGEWPIIVANAITLALATTILVRTWRARRRQALR